MTYGRVYKGRYRTLESPKWFGVLSLCPGNGHHVGRSISACVCCVLSCFLPSEDHSVGFSTPKQIHPFQNHFYHSQVTKWHHLNLSDKTFSRYDTKKNILFRTPYIFNFFYNLNNLKRYCQNDIWKILSIL